MENINETSLQPAYRAAGFWMRFWAYLVDLVIVFSIKGVVLYILRLLGLNQVMISYWTLGSILALITFFLYFALMTKYYGQTLGKMIFGLKVVAEKAGEELDWLDIIFREVVGRSIYKAFFFLNFLYLTVAFSKDKQGLHDFFGETKVIHIYD